MGARNRMASCLLAVAAVGVGAGTLTADVPHQATVLRGVLPPAATTPTATSTPAAVPTSAPTLPTSGATLPTSAATVPPSAATVPTDAASVPTGAAAVPTSAAAAPIITAAPRTPAPTLPVSTFRASPASRASAHQPSAAPASAAGHSPAPAAPATTRAHGSGKGSTPAAPSHRGHGRHGHPQHSPGPAGPVLWNGDFETGGVPHGATGPRCGTGSADGPDSASDQYSSTQEMGNTACTDQVVLTGERTRTPTSRRAARITMGPHQQRELLVSKFGWRPDAHGSVDLWYGLSLYYDPLTWQQGAGYRKELSAASWDDPFGLRTKGPNGSLNGSSDLRSDGPHLALRRNTVRNQQHFYADGLGLDEIDLGPVAVGRWMDLVVHVRWSTTSSNALREAWRDGVYRGRRISLNAVDELPHHLRVGQYQDTGIGHSRVTYIDNVRIGTSYAAVDPSR